MFPRRLPVLGLLVSTVALAGCLAEESAPPPAPRADVAVLTYAPPSGAPDFCTALAGSTHLTDLPRAVGTLVAQPGDVAAALVLTGAITELDDVLDVVRRQPGFLVLDRSLEDLGGALREARDGPLTEVVREAISDGLDDIGDYVQPVCDFPT
ncbi:hypothetical protein [Blastococcus sp. CT_GayMR16]|uniref:hypothetical protein n=1 Tax=Blastococcus sp. CT_GayMR16 TaxID=2559607 RepID=UPI00107435ED|nr:hypothetical protein [Blastococcus sp. CT_GayMR16]TFV89889.1 hypothetical protein E4P38_05390 [Blastococcus sp. CT_GayMR16]